jgi:hypothetical protein
VPALAVCGPGPQWVPLADLEAAAALSPSPANLRPSDSERSRAVITACAQLGMAGRTHPRGMPAARGLRMPRPPCQCLLARGRDPARQRQSALAPARPAPQAGSASEGPTGTLRLASRGPGPRDMPGRAHHDSDCGAGPRSQAASIAAGPCPCAGGSCRHPGQWPGGAQCGAAGPGRGQARSGLLLLPTRKSRTMRATRQLTPPPLKVRVASTYVRESNLESNIRDVTAELTTSIAEDRDDVPQAADLPVINLNLEQACETLPDRTCQRELPKQIHVAWQIRVKVGTIASAAKPRTC